MKIVHHQTPVPTAAHSEHVNVTYYKPTWATEENKNTAYMILDAHRLIDFPVLLDGDEE